MSFLLGLTGSIGMGKSTTASIFKDFGCDVWDADAAVHRAYSPGGAAVEQVRLIAPDAIENGAVLRDQLKLMITNDETFLAKLEVIIHPLVKQDRANFIKTQRNDILVFDIPLLFETQSQGEFDAVACVLTPWETQKQRVMARPGMTLEHFDLILSKQLPAKDKAAMADYVIATDTLDQAKEQVATVLDKIRGRIHNA